MGPYRRAMSAALIASIGFILAGCDSLDSITDLAIFDTKKKLPGDRKSVFPEGVPGVTQGIPPELQKGYSEQAAQPGPDPATAAVEQLTAKPEPKEKPKPKVAAKPRPKPQKPPAAQAQTQPQSQPSQQGTAPWPASSQQQQQQSSQAPWPSPR